MRRKYISLISIAVLFLAVLSTGCGNADSQPNSESRTLPTENSPQAIVSNSADWYIGKPVDTVVAELQSAGFIKVEGKAIDDLTSSSSIPDGSVIGIEIDGSSQFSQGDQFSKEAAVIVTYHRLPKITIPFSITDLDTLSYIEAAQLLVESGFSNVATDEIYDLDPDVSKNQLIDISVDGRTISEENWDLPFDAPIKVTGHFPYKKYAVNINIDFEENWIFSKYDVVLTLGNEEPILMEHGQGGLFDFRLQEGTYSLTFSKQDDPKISSEATIAVSCDIQATYHIQCHSDTIELEEQDISYIGQRKQNEVELCCSSHYFLRKNYETCVNTLRKMGFTNVNAEPVTDTLWGQTPAGSVTAITIAEDTDFVYGSIYKKSDKVILYYHIPEVQFASTSVEVIEGDPFTVSMSVSDKDNPEDISIQIQDESVVSQSERDSYIANTPGSTVIKALWGDICLAQCDVTVEKRIIPISGLILSEDEMTVAVGAVFGIEYGIEPENANYTDLTFVFNGTPLEKLENGLLYSSEAGDTEITISQDDRHLASLTVHAVEVPIETITVSPDPIRIGIGRTSTVEFDLQPESATNISLEVSSSKPNIATASIDPKGDRTISITGVAKGTAKITVKTATGISTTLDVIVEEVMPEQIILEADTPKPFIGSSGTLSLKFIPEDVTSGTVTWSSKSPNVIRVKRDGSYQALSVGTAIITAKHACGLTQTLEMEVLPVEVESISISTNWDASKPFYKNNTMTLRAEILPENATYKNIVWASSNESIATVTKQGVVKAVSDGQVEITATAANGVKAVFPVTVDISPQKFRVTATLRMTANDHVGGQWSSGLTCNEEAIRSGSVISILPGDTFQIVAWAEDSDANPDYGCHVENITLTKEMCTQGIVIEDEFYVRENGGRYSGNTADWYVKITLTPVK